MPYTIGLGLCAVAFVVMVLLFQNCSEGFEATQASTKGSLQEVDPTAKTVAICPIMPTAATRLSNTCFAQLRPRMLLGGSYFNFVEYEPQYPLYNDGATKRRWIYLPVGQKIDNSDPDNWRFPQGTIIYKQFLVDGILIETRQMEKVGPGDGAANWRFTIYGQLADQSDALLVTAGLLDQPPAVVATYAAGAILSRYRIGNLTQCLRCHGSTLDVVRGFGFLQLSSPTAAFNVNTAYLANFISVNPGRLDMIPGGAADKAVIGYIQSNCANCHNGIGPGPGDFRHSSTSKTLAEEPLIKTAIATPGLITPKDPATSGLYDRFSSGTMPAVRPIRPDAQAIEAMRLWILNMTALGTPSNP